LRFPYIKNFMLGRGALQDPFLPSVIKGQLAPSVNKISMIGQFHDEVFNYYKNTLCGEKHLCDKMKEFWVYMSVHTDIDGRSLKRIKKCHTTAAYLEAINPLLHSLSMWSDSSL